MRNNEWIWWVLGAGAAWWLWQRSSATAAPGIATATLVYGPQVNAQGAVVNIPPPIPMLPPEGGADPRQFFR